MVIPPVLKTGARKGLRVRVSPPPPSFTFSEIEKPGTSLSGCSGLRRMIFANHADIDYRKDQFLIYHRSCESNHPARSVLAA